MEFSYKKSISLKPQKEKYLFTFLVAFATATAIFLPYMLLSKGYFIFFGDFNVQQIPFYQECHQAVRDGNIFWSWSTDLGANFIGSYSFYLLGSPFFWLTIPFPNSFVPYLMGPLLILKFACAALMAYMYIRRFTRTPQAASLGGILYAFCGFSIYNIFFNHFHEAIIVFPLLLLSLELLITENRRFCFATMVLLTVLVNYFFFFGMVVFCVIYYFVRVFSKAVKFKFSSFFVLVFEAALGVLMSAFLLLPSILAIIGNYRVSSFLEGWTAILYGKEQIYSNVLQCFFFPPDLPARPVFFPEANVKWSSLGGWLPVFSMVGVFTWFSKRKNHWLGRVIGICIFMALVPILNSAFYAFNTAYYARWYYMPILMMCLATVSLLEDRKVNWSFGYKWVLGITIATSVVIGFFPQKTDDGKWIFGLYTQGNNQHDRITYMARFWVSCVIAIAGLVVFGLLLRLLNNNRKTFFNWAITSVCIVAIIYGNVFIATGRAHSYEIKNVMIDQLIEGDVQLGDGEHEFRIDVYDGVDNTAMFLNYPTINAFHSIVPASVFEFYEFMGDKRDVGSRPNTDLYAIRPLLSVKYLLNRVDGDSFIDEDSKETKMFGYKYLKTENGYYVYENQYYIPFGFTYDYFMTYDMCKDYQYNGNRRAALMLKAILLTDEQIEKYGYMYEDVQNLSMSYIGEETTTLAFTNSAYAYDCSQRAKSAAYYFNIDKNSFEAKITTADETLVFFSVPFDEGWSATVNGKTVEIEKVNAGFMAVKSEAGHNDIVFKYKTPGLLDGIKITVISSLVLLLYIFVYSVYKKRRHTEINYPEGDIMIETWLAQQAEEVESENIQNNKSILDNFEQDGQITADPELSGGFTIDSDFFEDK